MWSINGCDKHQSLVSSHVWRGRTGERDFDRFLGIFSLEILKQIRQNEICHYGWHSCLLYYSLHFSECMEFFYFLKTPVQSLEHCMRKKIFAKWMSDSEVAWKQPWEHPIGLLFYSAFWALRRRAVGYVAIGKKSISSATADSGRQWSTAFKVLRENYFELRILYPGEHIIQVWKQNK